MPAINVDSVEQCGATAASVVVEVLKNCKLNLCATQAQAQRLAGAGETKENKVESKTCKININAAAAAAAFVVATQTKYTKGDSKTITTTNGNHSRSSNSLTKTKNRQKHGSKSKQSKSTKIKERVTAKATATAASRARKRSSGNSGGSIVIIIMTLVFSIIQQIQEQHQQQQQQEQRQQHQFNNNGLFWMPFVAVLASAATLPQTETSQVTLHNYNALEYEDVVVVKQNQIVVQPQTRTTNHTFQSLAFIDDAAAAAAAASEAAAAAALAAAAASSSVTFDDTAAVSDTSTEVMPIFDFGMPRNITGRTGHTEAIIKCRVDNLNDKSVSWIRKRDLHILTVGTATYTSDKRFQVTESKDSREWTLHVKAPQARDSGIYECQVNTEPKISMAFQLNIIEISPDARAIISGPADLHFKVGSAITLNCIVQQPSVKDIGPIYWYRGEHMITPFDADENADVTSGNTIDTAVYNVAMSSGKVNSNKNNGNVLNDMDAVDNTLNDIMTNYIQKDFATRIAMESQLGDTLKSRLRISNAQTTDTGNYTCQPTTASSASVMVHVINDENPAAMQKSAAVALFAESRRFGRIWLLLLLLLKVICMTTTMKTPAPTQSPVASRITSMTNTMTMTKTKISMHSIGIHYFKACTHTLKPTACKTLYK